MENMEINGVETAEARRYDTLALSPEVMGALQNKGYEVATPIQSGCIPFLMDDQDVVAKAPTGTGKTYAFGIPIVEHTDPEGTDVTSLILAPTRELALQIRDDLRELSALKKLCRVIQEYNSDKTMDYASVQEAMDGICLTIGDIQQATTHFKKAMAIYEVLFESEPDVIEAKKQELLETYTQSGVYLGKKLLSK